MLVTKYVTQPMMPAWLASCLSSWAREALMVDAAEDPALLETLLAELDPSTDLARLVERVWRNNLSQVVVSAPALTAWQQRDPAGWEKVSAWLAAKGVTIVRVSEGTGQDA
jgi:hypothetical protein